MITSLKCYEKAIELDPSNVDKNDLVHRMGKMQNELGHFHMAVADCKFFISLKIRVFRIE